MTNLGTSWRLLRRALLLQVLGVLLTVLSGVAHADDKKVIVVLDIQGGGKKLQDAIIAKIKESYTLLPTNKWNQGARKLTIVPSAPEDYAMVAAEVKADAVITGRVKQDKDSGQWKLNIAARNGQTGKPLGKMTYDLKTQKVDADTITQVTNDLGAAVDKALKGDAPEPPPAAPEPAPTNPSALGIEEDPIAKMKKLEEEQKRLAGFQARPVWYPYVDANVGFSINSRSFGFAQDPNPSSPVGCYEFKEKNLPQQTSGVTPVYIYNAKNSPSCGKFDGSVAAGIHLDITGYPLAWISQNPVRGLGIGLSFDYVIWPDSISKTGASLATTEYRYELGLRYHYNIFNKRSRPSILANVQYGGHFFAVAKEAKTYTYTDPVTFNPNQMTKGYDDHGLPDINYQYITIGVGGRVPYYATEKLFFGLLLNFNFHAVLGYGEIAQGFDKNANPAPATASAATCADPTTLYCVNGYGPVASGFGLRASLTLLEAMFWRGLTVRLSGYYELFQYSFQLGSGTGANTSLPPIDRDPSFGARRIAQSASDNYFGGVVQVGYQY